LTANPNWKSLSIQIPGQDLLEGARNSLETLVVYLEVIKTILETVKVFLVDFGNPIRALLEALLAQIEELFKALQQTGVYAWYDVPDPTKDPHFNRFVGGFPAFVTRFKAGLYDPRDPNRPQPVPGLDFSGFTLIVADAESIVGLLHLLSILMDFFGKKFLKPQYLAPVNFKVLPVGDKGDPILSIVRVFQTQPKSVAVEWSLPPSTIPGDPGFSDLFGQIAVDFIPPRFLIEKSEINPAVGEVDVSKLTDANATGQVVATLPSKFENRGKPGVPVKYKSRLMDEYHDPFFKFQKYIIVDTSHSTGTFILGQLGTYRYIDSDVELDKTYYYRVRAYSGNLNITGTTINFATKTDVIDSTPFIPWPGTDPNNPPVMGKATPIAPIRIPTYPEKFNVIENLDRLFQTAFSLNFHLPFPSTPAEDSNIGKGSLTSLASPLTSFQAIPLVGSWASSLGGVSAVQVTSKFQRNPVTGKLPTMPWNTTMVVYNSARLATIVAGAMLQANSAVAFKAFMEGPYPKGAPSVTGLIATNLSELVLEITNVQDEETAGQTAVQAAGTLYGSVYGNAKVRENVLAAINFCKTFTLGGASPDWIQISILRDIVPWSGQLLYELLAKMQALLDAYSGVIDEIKAFIDLIVRKIDVLEQFLEYLISILDFVLSLSLGFYILSVPQTSGDTNEWASLIDNAGGTPPPSGPGGYTGGVAFAYVGPNVGPYVAAFKLIF